MMPRRVSSSTMPVRDWPGHSVQEANAVLRRAFQKRDYLFAPCVPTRSELTRLQIHAFPRKSYGMGGEDPYKLNQAVARLNDWTD